VTLSLILEWPLAIALASAGLNGVIGALAWVRSRGQALYRALALMSLSFSLWSIAYLWAWPEFIDPFWMKMLFSPLSWLPGAALSFVWCFTGLPSRQRRLRTAPLYALGFLALGLMWAGRIDLQQFRAAFIMGGIPIFGGVLYQLTVYWNSADPGAERNRRGYFLVAAWIAVLGGFADFIVSFYLPFMTTANLALMAYSLIILLAIERHHLLDLRAAAGQAFALIAGSSLLAAALAGLVWTTRRVNGSMYLNFFVVSVVLVGLLPPLWERANRAFNRLFFERHGRRELALERFETVLADADSLDSIEKAAAAVIEEEWGAESVVLWAPGALGGLEPTRVLPPDLEAAVVAGRGVWTDGALERENGKWAKALGRGLRERGMRAIAPVIEENTLLGVVFFGPPAQDFYDLAALRWIRRLAQAVSRAAKSAQTAQRLLHSDRLAQMGTLAAGIAHEIRNPLSAMLGAVEVLRMNPPGNQREEFLSILKEEVQRLDGILTDLLDYASPKSREARCEWSKVRDRVVKLLKPDIPDTLTLAVGDGDVSLAVSGAHLQQILLNLIKNAVRAVDGKGSVSAELAVSGGTATLSIQDDGPGIPEDVLPRLFTPFASRAEGGTGLGLATVRRLAELYGGRAWAENPGTGARFSVELPLA
jgi:signal transduction histidine kinase